VMIREIAVLLGIRHHAIQKVVVILVYQKVCSCRFPDLLIDKLKMTCMDVSLQLL
jgi:hypothetical protein